MFKFIALLSLFTAAQAFAQDLSQTESFETSYKEMPDGTSRYVGKCSTHEDYDKLRFTVKKVLQKYVEPRELSAVELQTVILKFDRPLLAQFMALANLEAVTDMDDVELVTLNYPGLDLVRIGYGVGGGNGGFAVYSRTQRGTYKLMSHTFDHDLEFCDAKVWR